jgi:hypothetical protein
MSAHHRLRGRTKAWVGVALAGSGLAAGAILGSTVTAGASPNPAATLSSSSGSNGSSSTSAASGTSGSSGGASSGTATQRPPDRGLPQSGTVTASGKTYAVTSNSDIDKNGEASLSSLAVGDAVTFDTDPSAATPTIDKLHAGSESLDRPTGPPAEGPPGDPPSSASGSTSSTVG